MKQLGARRLIYNPEAIYHYPHRLKPLLDKAPALPGVYIFYGESATLPLYVGKSINLRARMLSHFRTIEEAEMLRQTVRLDWIVTAGELGALLLEAQMIKAHQPLFNKRLRKNRQLCSLYLHEDKLDIVYARDVDFSKHDALYGLYRHRSAALEYLKKIADRERLCHGLLGLEKLPHHRPCFRAALARCAGACCGKESKAQHHLRLVAALEKLKVVCWPWQGAVGLVEKAAHQTQIHVVDNWFYLGSAATLPQARQLFRTSSNFDHDGYKILCRPLLSGRYSVVDLSK